MSVKLWKTGKYNILAIILSLLEMLEEYPSLISFPNKKLKNLTLDKYSLLLWLNLMIQPLSFLLLVITTEMYTSLILVLSNLNNLGKKDKMAGLKTHYKMVRSLSFT